LFLTSELQMRQHSLAMVHFYHLLNLTTNYIQKYTFSK
jgi:hypothetical protein